MAQEYVDVLVKDNRVVVFSKSYCPYCNIAKSALKDAGLTEYKVLELDLEVGELMPVFKNVFWGIALL